MPRRLPRSRAAPPPVVLDDAMPEQEEWLPVAERHAGEGVAREAGEQEVIAAAIREAMSHQQDWGLCSGEAGTWQGSLLGRAFTFDSTWQR